MVKLAQIPLETYLLAEQAVPLACLVCDHENCRSTERCRNCSAPMALAHQALAVNEQPHMIAVIGARGAGKTVYLGMLMDMLTRQGSTPRTTARGPLSISLQQTVTTSLATGWFPDKTPNNPEHWHWVHCQFQCRRRRRPIELVLPDIAGDALAEETERPGKHPSIRALLRKCAGVMVLTDAERLQAGDHSDDFVTMKLISLLSELCGGKGARRLKIKRERRPLALVLTKADACERCLEDPLDFAEAHGSTLLRDCQSRFPNNAVFACSIAGACVQREVYGARQHVPLRVEPHGIMQPFGWLMTKIAI